MTQTLLGLPGMTQTLRVLAGALTTAIGITLIAWFFARVRSGRLGRTLDQATKVIGFVELCSAAYDALAKLDEAKRSEVEKLMLDTLQAVREDFAAERAMLPAFAKTASSFRRALFFYLPHRAINWLLLLLFHTLLVFMVYDVILIITSVLLSGGWPPDAGVAAVALPVAIAFAVLVRFAVRLFPEPDRA
jgi:hypothetical protein